MRKTLFLLLFVVRSVCAQVPPVDALPLADPFVLCDEGRYYAYGTGSDDGIVVLVSDDLKRWYWPQNRAGFLALDRADSYGDRWFWAPEVYRVGDRYYMFYSADEHICVATAASPLGPFRQQERRPMRDEPGIDNTLFIDQDGTPYLFWVRFDRGNEVWSARLEEDLQRIVPGSERFCIRTSQEWERVMPSVNEGPFVVRHDGRYYLTYSANSYESQAYGVGYATASSIGGEWTKAEENPILCMPEGIVGVGHHAFFRDRRGRMRVVFHSHRDSRHIHPRIMHLSTAKFRRGKGTADRLEIDPRYRTPQLVAAPSKVPRWVMELGR